MGDVRRLRPAVAARPVAELVLTVFDSGGKWAVSADAVRLPEVELSPEELRDILRVGIAELERIREAGEL